MSMRTWTEEGYGYALFNGNNLDNIKNFLIENGNYSDEDIAFIRLSEDVEDLREVTDDPVSWVIAAHINKKEGTFRAFSGFDSCGDTEQEQMLGIRPQFPWVFRPEEMLSKEKANQILEKYAGILGITETPDWFTAEYYG